MNITGLEQGWGLFLKVVFATGYVVLMDYI